MEQFEQLNIFENKKDFIEIETLNLDLIQSQDQYSSENYEMTCFEFQKARILLSDLLLIGFYYQDNFEFNIKLANIDFLYKDNSKVTLCIGYLTSKMEEWRENDDCVFSRESIEGTYNELLKIHQKYLEKNNSEVFKVSNLSRKK